MIEDYKKFLKENKELFYTMFSTGGFAIFFTVIITSFFCIFSNIERSYSNNKQLNTYRENLATFQKCAEKIEDTSFIRSYCGDPPNEPTLIW